MKPTFSLAALTAIVASLAAAPAFVAAQAAAPAPPPVAPGANGCTTVADCAAAAVAAAKAAQKAAETAYAQLHASLVGAVIPFNAAACPAGWDEYTPAQGRFIRGIDKAGGTTDPDGHRTPGSQQGDAIASFTITYKAKELVANGGHGFWGEGFDTNSNGNTKDFPISYQGAAETRPRNVSLLYCVMK